MFTGLVQQLGRLERIALSGGSGRLAVAAGFPNPETGESIAVNGVCLTLTRHSAGHLEFDVLRETLDRTALGGKAAGALLHLERALRMGDAVGGHWVSGHVDGTGTVVSCEAAGRDRILAVRAPDLLPGIVCKGSVALDGVSLTVVQTDPARGLFSVHLIPHTWENTAFSALKPGDRLNIETDMLGKYVRQQQLPSPAPSAPPLTMERLRNAGF
jgi:riboflavin synthase